MQHKKNLVIIFFSILLVIHHHTHAQVIEKLWKAGFEQVHVLESDDTLKVFLEKRSFRYPVHTLEFASLELKSATSKPILWIPIYHNRPMGAYSQEKYIYRPLKKEEIQFFKSHNDLGRAYRFHLRLMPDFNVKFGNYGNPFQNKTSIILDTRLYLLPGLSLNAGILFPLNNSLDNQKKNIRPGPTFVQWFSHPGNHFLTIIGGTFLSDRYGIDFQYRFAPLDRFFSLGIESTFTGFYFWPESGIYSEKLKEFTLVGDVEWRLPPFPRISARFSAGQYLFGNRGIRFDLIRQWGSVDISFYGSMTKAGNNAGFQFIIPIFPGAIYRTNRLEIRSTEEFPWEYSFSNEAPSARNYRLSVPRLSDVVRQYNHHLWISR